MSPDLDLLTVSQYYDMSELSTLGNTQDLAQKTGPYEGLSIAEIQFVEAVNWLSVYYTSILIAAGIVCNPLSFIVLSRRAFRDSPMSVYLRYLSFSDFGATIFAQVTFFLVAFAEFDIWQDLLRCRLLYWLGCTFLTGSSWTLVAVTTERVISIIWPHRARSRLCATVVVIIIIASVAVVYSPIFLYFGPVESFNDEDNTTLIIYCQLSPGPLNPLFYYLDAAFFAFVPILFLMIFNVIILMGVIESGRRVSRISATSASNPDDRTSYQNHSQTSATKGKFRKSQRRGRFSPSSRESSLTVTLLAINVAFIVCNFPVSVYQLAPYYQTAEGFGPVGMSISTVTLLVMFTNNSLNFLLYCIMGSKFRKEVKAVIFEIFILPFHRRK